MDNVEALSIFILVILQGWPYRFFTNKILLRQTQRLC